LLLALSDVLRLAARLRGLARPHAVLILGDTKEIWAERESACACAPHCAHASRVRAFALWLGHADARALSSMSDQAPERAR